MNDLCDQVSIIFGLKVIGFGVTKLELTVKEGEDGSNQEMEEPINRVIGSKVLVVKLGKKAGGINSNTINKIK
jgi:translation elongation factor EF-1beta